MKRTILLISLLLAVTVSAYSQKVHKATKEAKEESELQLQSVRNAVELHDEGKYAEAIEIYKKVLNECPDCPLTMYELGLSYYASGDNANAIKHFENSTRYKTRVRASSIRMLGNVLDNNGKRQEALKLFKKSLKINGKNAYTHYDIGLLYYNLRNQKEARKHIKKAIEYNPGFASSHGLLSVIFRQTGYKIPAVLASLKFMSIGATSQNAPIVAKYLASEFKKPVKNAKGGFDISLNLSEGKKDEGDFSTIEAAFSLLSAASLAKDGEKQTDAEFFAKRLDGLEDFLSDYKGKSNFTQKTYFKFFSEMKSKGYLLVIANVTLAENGSDESKQWIRDNAEKVIEFSEWASAYDREK